MTSSRRLAIQPDQRAPLPRKNQDAELLAKEQPCCNPERNRVQKLVYTEAVEGDAGIRKRKERQDEPRHQRVQIVFEFMQRR